MAERFSLAWVLCGDISHSSSTAVSLCVPHPVSVGASFSVQPFPVDRSPLLLWPLLALLELSCRPSIHLRPVPPPLLLVVAPNYLRFRGLRIDLWRGKMGPLFPGFLLLTFSLVLSSLSGSNLNRQHARCIAARRDFSGLGS